MWVHPSTPNHAEIQAVLSDVENMLVPYMTAGTLLTQNLYRDLKLPWDFPESKESFDQASFERRYWDLNGIPSSAPLPDGTPGPFALISDPKALHCSVSMFVKALGSTSSVIRYRQANPDKANTEDDFMHVAANRLREANGGKDALWMSPSMSLLLLRRS